jgi:DNA invertase Pin-like site-specific DNA recombinase
MDDPVKRAALYVRVSTELQNTKAQEIELQKYVQQRGWAVKRIYADVFSGSKDKRPALNELMNDCRKKEVDIVAVWKFDRFGRSLRHLVTALDEFKSLGIAFVSATEGVDTGSAAGELIFQIFGAIAQWERQLTVERVKCGLRQAKRDGKIIGRPAIKVLSAREIERIRRERLKGVTLKELATSLKASMWSVHQASLKTRVPRV